MQKRFKSNVNRLTHLIRDMTVLSRREAKLAAGRMAKGWEKGFSTCYQDGGYVVEGSKCRWVDY